MPAVPGRIPRAPGRKPACDRTDRVGRLLDVIEIRELTADDWATWRDLRLAALAEAPYAFGSRLADWQQAPEERWRDRLSIPASYNVLADLDGRPVGMASGIPAEDEPDAVELISMWVSPDARGRQVGDRLVAAIADWGRRVGAGRLVLAVAADNSRATAFYHRHGFVESGAPPRPMGDGDSARCELVMTKPLLQGS